MQIVGGKSEYFEDKPHHTGYYITLNNFVLHRSCSCPDFNDGRWSVVRKYHKDNSSDSIDITAEQYMNNDIPYGYSGEILSGVYNKCYEDNPNIPNNEALEILFKRELKIKQLLD